MIWGAHRIYLANEEAEGVNYKFYLFCRGKFSYQNYQYLLYAEDIRIVFFITVGNLMSLTIEIAARREFKNADLWEMHKLRAKVFRDRKGWDVSVMGDMEIDGYDAIDPYYMMMREPEGILRGCWRLLPTEGPYMLKDTFPQLLHGVAAPVDSKIWELSRFAIEAKGEGNFGFSAAAMQSIDEIIIYGYRMRIEQYVTVTTTAIERMLRRAGVVIQRFGPPIQIGVENTVALYVDIQESYRKAQITRIDKNLHFNEYSIDFSIQQVNNAVNRRAVFASKQRVF